MEVSKFEELVKDARKYLRDVFNTKGDIRISEVKEQILWYFGMNCSKFEEETLIENLKEEFGEIMNGEVA